MGGVVVFDFSGPRISPFAILAAPAPTIVSAGTRVRLDFSRCSRRRRFCMAAAGNSVPSSLQRPEVSGDGGIPVVHSSRNSENDLLIVGPGVLGRLIADIWKQEHEECRIFGQTATVQHHEELLEIGIVPSLKGSDYAQKIPYVIFCAPSYGSDDYCSDIRAATLNWSGEGSFLFTSSTAPYNCCNNGECSEDSPVVPMGRSRRTDVLLEAEKMVLDVGGCVLRLAGLYNESRGAHAYWLQKGTVDVRPDHVLNLIHYEDAASLSVAIMKKKQLRSRIFVGCDNHPLSRQKIMDCVSKSGKFDRKFEGFTGTKDPLGKRMNNSKTRGEIGWEPKYPSFPEFLGLKEDYL